MAEVMTINELVQMLDHNEAAELADYIEDFNAVDIAQLLPELSDEQVWKLCSLLETENLAKVLEQAEDEQAVRMAESITNDELIEVFSYMQKDDIADLIGEIPDAQRKMLIKQMQVRDRNAVQTLLQYPEDSAGGIMTTAYISLPEDMTVSDGMTKIKQTAEKTEVIETIYIVNAKHQLTGICNLRQILTAQKNTMLKDIMNENVIAVHPEDDQEEVAKLVSRYDLNAIPVINNRRSIMGIITVDDIIDVIVEEYNEDILEMAGVSKEESLSTSLWESIKLRLPWLLINLGTAFLASLTVKAFEGTIAQVVALSSTMTIVSGMGGNAGTQTQSILVRQLAQDDIPRSKYWKAFWKEILLGVINGAVNGAVTGLIVYAVYGNAFLGIIILIAMIGNLVVAGIFGFVVPVLLKKLGADPAVASSIFVTTATDVLGFFIFLGLAQLFLPLLV
ncbi:MAG: magnesium transporter [Solobacterium sp.]|jgi:magnesium transporter|nr:magnesium transporter [Solobacterium sp.]MCH4205476.1 magnesium transporter [Solobacterium sp.]MCH4227000.1 magnesium transporter [Solobacterium sp.]MCH4282163.1 magnesium transporter [Solobacterium sp.]